MRLLARCVVALLLFCSSLGSAVPQETKEKALVAEGFIMAERYLKFDQTEQAICAAGLIDGMYLAPVF